MKEIEWEHCNRCNGKRKHDVLYQDKINYSEKIDEKYSIGGSDSYEVLKCCGCESVQFRHKSWFSENVDPETGEPKVVVRCYPPPLFRKEPEWLYAIAVSDKEVFYTALALDEKIIKLFTEIYIALQNDAPQLAVLGIRALLESIMIDKIGDKGSFEDNIEAFEKEGYISPKQKDVLKPIIEAGHAAMHRGYRPKRIEVARIMDVTENIIETIYINENRISKISEKIPVRQKRIKAKKNQPDRRKSSLAGYFHRTPR
jgi:hypothetical protein